VKWEEVENCLKKGDPNLLVFDADQVLDRAKKYGDLFEPVLKLKQKMPLVEVLASLGSASELTSNVKVPKPTQPVAARHSPKKTVSKKAIAATGKAGVAGGKRTSPGRTAQKRSQT
jgi:bifunctional non-homologous end joining protein LigD